MTTTNLQLPESLSFPIFELVENQMWNGGHMLIGQAGGPFTNINLTHAKLDLSALASDQVFHMMGCLNHFRPRRLQEVMPHYQACSPNLLPRLALEGY